MAQRSSLSGTWRRAATEIEHAKRTCRAIIETEVIEDAKVLARNLLHQLERWFPSDASPRRRR